MRSISIAHFSPLPPQRSGIARYCAELLPHLAAHMAVDVYVDTLPQVDSALARAFRIHSISEFPSASGPRGQVDICVYHMGNQPAYHERIYTALLHHPGIVVLHEFDLHGFYLNRTRPDNATAFLREMGYAYGLDGVREARLVVAGRWSVPVGTRPLFNRIVDVSLGVIVHTEYARRMLLAASTRARVAHIPLAASQPSAVGSLHPPALFEQFPPGTIVLASFGYIAPSKRIESILLALAQVRAEISNFRYVLVGERIPGCDFRRLIDDLGLADMVHVTGFVEDSEFQAYLNSVDIGINLRTGPTGGEMSAAVVRLLACGRPTIVSNVGGFADLPDECVVKIRQDEDEVAQLVAALRHLIVDAQARAAYGEAARRYVQREFAFPVVAQKYATFIRECLESIMDGSLEAYAH